MLSKEPITITEEQFVEASSRAIKKALDKTKDPQIILSMGVVTALISRELFHGGGLMEMWGGLAMIDDVLVDVLRRAGKMSRADLVKALNLTSKHPDRQLRNIKERVNLGTGRFANTLIVGFSDRKGYKLADTEAELTHFIIETNHLLMSLQAQLSKAWRLREDIRRKKREEKE